MTNEEIKAINTELKKKFPNTVVELNVMTNTDGSGATITHKVNGLAHYEIVKTGQGSGIVVLGQRYNIEELNSTFEEDLKEIVKQLEMTKSYSDAILSAYKKIKSSLTKESV